MKLLTQTTKMPCKSWSLPSLVTCPTGKMLAINPLSVCHCCYAHSGFYNMPVVRRAQARRLEFASSKEFVSVMVKELTGTKEGIFRWHDSGDLFSKEYTRKVFDVILATPQILHRLPTREVAFIKEILPIPENAIVQISGDYLDQLPPSVPEGCTASMVFTTTPPKGVYICPATTIRNKCLECRACWDRNIKCVGYKKH